MGNKNGTKMTAPTKQQLRDLIAELREEVSHLQNQLTESESLRDTLAQRAGELDKERSEILEQRNEYLELWARLNRSRYKAHNVLELTEQLSLKDVESILYAFKDRFDGYAISGSGGFDLLWADQPIDMIDGTLHLIFDMNKSREEAA